MHAPEAEAEEGEHGAVPEGEEAEQFEEETDAEEALGGEGVIGDEADHAVGGFPGLTLEAVEIVHIEILFELEGDIGNLREPFPFGADELGNAGGDVTGGDELLGKIDEEGRQRSVHLALHLF